MTTSTAPDSTVPDPSAASDGPPVEHPEAHPAAAGTPNASSTSNQSAAAARPQRTMSILALSLGIASFFFAQTVVVPLAAVLLGVFGLRDEPTGRSFSVWGIVLAIVATFGWVVVVVAGALLSLPFLLLAAF